MKSFTSTLVVMLVVFAVISFAIDVARATAVDVRVARSRRRLRLQLGMHDQVMSGDCGPKSSQAQGRCQFPDYICCKEVPGTHKCHKIKKDKETCAKMGNGLKDPDGTPGQYDYSKALVQQAAQQQAQANSHACGNLCEKRDEPTRRFGVEIEMKNWEFQMGQFNAAPFKAACPELDAAKWESKFTTIVDHPLKKKSETWYSYIYYNDKGYKAMYQGQGEWAQWNLHLDGQGRILELVTAPGSADEIGAALAVLHKFLHNATYGHDSIKKLVFGGGSFKPINEDDESKAVYCYLKSHSMFGTRIQESKTVKIAERATQITTTYTPSEIGKSSFKDALCTKLGLDSSDPTKDADNLMFKHLNASLFEGKEKPKDLLVKHAAEQLHDTAFLIPNSIPSPFDFNHKLQTSYKMHSRANKISPVMKRGQETAYMMEFRGKFDDNLEKAFAVLMDTSDATAKKFSDLIKTL